jgi:hypothetical protein
MEKNRGDKPLRERLPEAVVVASDIFGVSGWAMMAALVAGEHDPQALADPRPDPDADQDQSSGGNLRRAWTGHLRRSRPVPAARMLARVDAIDADIAAVDAQIGQHLDLSMMRSPVSMRSRARSPFIPTARRPEPASVRVERLRACFAPADEGDGLWILLPKCSW